MTLLFADTSYFLALLIPDDINHERALHWSNGHVAHLVTSEYVLLEVGNHLSPVSTRLLMVPFTRALRNDRRATIVPGSRQLFDKALELYYSRADKRWSLIDCSSFVIMKKRRIIDALTADRHFEQAGFRPLLRSKP